MTARGSIAFNDVVSVDEIIPPPLCSEPSPANRTTVDYLARRLKLALNDLGLESSVPAHWITPAQNGVVFAVLNVRHADELVRRLEDLAAGHQVTPESPGPGQLSFFGDARR